MVVENAGVISNEKLDEIYHTQVEVGRETVAQAMEMAKSSKDSEMMSKNLERASEIVIGAVGVLKKY